MGLNGLDKCWNRIGIFGNKTCMELTVAIHCRNCKTYSKEGRNLLYQSPPKEYKQNWTSVIASEKRTPLSGDMFSVFIFTIGKERLSVKTEFVKSVVSGSMIHFVPHRSNKVLLGLINVEGDLLPCVSMAHLFDFDSSDSDFADTRYSRMIVLDDNGELWVFQADNVEGIFHFSQNNLEEVPVTLAKASFRFSVGLFERNEKKIALLDEKKVFELMQRNIS